MRRSLLWLAFSIAMVIAILIVSNLLKPSDSWQNLESTFLNFDEPVILSEEADTAAEVALTVRIPEQSETLSFSSQAEVFRFTLESAGAYTLRYLTLHAYPEGLKPIEEWTIYEEIDGEIDFSSPVASSEKFEANLLRFRFFSSPSAGYIAESGTQTFVVYAAVLNDQNSDQAPKLTITFPQNLEKEWDFAWLPGRKNEAWLKLTESLGLAEINSLPSDVIRKY